MNHSVGVKSVLLVVAFSVGCLSLSAPSRAADQAPAFGRLKAHELLWTQHEQQTANAAARLQSDSVLAAEEAQKEEAATKRISVLTAELGKLRVEVNVAPSVLRSEFETTQEFEARRQIESKAKREGLAAEIQAKEQALTEARRTLADCWDRQRERHKRLEADQSTITPPSDLCMVPVIMPLYDADHRRIPEFKMTEFYNVGSSPGGPMLYELSGSLAGIPAEIDKAKQLRSLSDNRGLIAAFRGRPASVSFQAGIVETIPAKPAAKASELEQSLWAGAAGLIAAAFGGDPAQAAGNARQSMNNSDSALSSAKPAQVIEHPVRLICAKWQGTPKIEALYGWDPSTKQWNLVWSPSP